MKKIKNIIAIGLIAVILSSCATFLGGEKVTVYQKTKPKPGEQKRKIRFGYLIADIILFPAGIIIDFATGAIYKPYKPPSNTSDTLNVPNDINNLYRRKK